MEQQRGDVSHRHRGGAQDEHITCPQSECRAWAAIINTQKFADHHPIHVEMMLLVRHQAQHGMDGDDERIPWARDKLINGVKAFASEKKQR